MTENKKIKNATPKEFAGIKFKSIEEVRTYKTLLSAGFNPEYEKRKFILWEGFKPTVPFYTKVRESSSLSLNSTKLINITYTPDFTFEYNGVLIIIEVKGFENDVFPVKKKLFRGVLEKYPGKVLFFEVYTKRQTLEAIEIIKNYDCNRENREPNTSST